jgi:hypothetical protein
MGNHTRPPSSSQAKIRCKKVGTKMVDKYKLAEYIRNGLATTCGHIDLSFSAASGLGLAILFLRMAKIDRSC